MSPCRHLVLRRAQGPFDLVARQVAADEAPRIALDRIADVPRAAFSISNDPSSATRAPCELRWCAGDQGRTVTGSGAVHGDRHSPQDLFRVVGVDGLAE